jgi:hypothetical protein
MQASISALAVALVTLGCATRNSPKGSQDSQGRAEQKVGLSVNDPRAFQGYTLLAPMTSTRTYLLNMQGQVVHQWDSDCFPALSAELLENGHLLRTGTLDVETRPFGGSGAGGRIQEFTWEGELVWDYTFFTDSQLPHHDITKLPNGNVLMIVWQNKTGMEAVTAGRKTKPSEVGLPLRSDSIIEVQPTGKTTAKVVWQWHMWDHLIQDYDTSKANYEDVPNHPELIDINFVGNVDFQSAMSGTVDKLRSIGYLRSGPAKQPKSDRDWAHINSVAYNAELDQIVLSVRTFDEIWIIDHGTTTAEAAGHTGGRRGKGGDLLYRWGNPRAYRPGTDEDQHFFGQHNAHWIGRGLLGEGHLLVFNNGLLRPNSKYSSVDELVLPLDADGQYRRKPGAAFGPEDLHWSYTAPNKTDFYSGLLSGAQRLPNGNTLICSGVPGAIFEVTAEGEVVWEYTTPVHSSPEPSPGTPGLVTKSGVETAATNTFTSNSIFRAHRYAPNYPGLIGRDLTPGKTVEELLGNGPPPR